jgi:hypothetical protein
LKGHTHQINFRFLEFVGLKKSTSSQIEFFLLFFDAEIIDNK